MGIDVLRYIDVVVGLSVVMLLASTLVTAITQAVVRFLNLRGRNLRNGVVQLIKQIDPLLEPHAQAIAECVLKHRLVAEPESIFGPVLRWLRHLWRGWGLEQRLGSVIQREELIRVLAELAATGLPAAAFGGKTDAERGIAADAVQRKLKEAIGADPAALLRGIRERSLQLERNAPWLATHVRQTQAIIDAAANDVVGTATQFVARVNAWFDNSMDRVSQSFAQHTRLLTIVGAAIVALGLPLDSLDLLKRLSVDDAFRKSLVERGDKIADAQGKSATTTGGEDEDKARDDATPEAKEAEFSLQIEGDKINQQLAELQNPQLALVQDEWWIEHYFSTPCTEKSELTSEKPRTLVVAEKQVPVTATDLKALGDAINKSGAPLSAEVQTCKLGSWLSCATQEGTHLVVKATGKPPVPTIELRAESIADPSKPLKNLLQPTWRFRCSALLDTLSRPGILLSIVLLSLGGPFWFEVLKSGLKLRPMLAGKEDKERDYRKSTQDAPAGAAVIASSAPPAPPAAPPAARAAAAPPAPGLSS